MFHGREGGHPRESRRGIGSSGSSALTIGIDPGFSRLGSQTIAVPCPESLRLLDLLASPVCSRASAIQGGTEVQRISSPSCSLVDGVISQLRLGLPRKRVVYLVKGF